MAKGKASRGTAAAKDTKAKQKGFPVSAAYPPIKSFRARLCDVLTEARKVLDKVPSHNAELAAFPDDPPSVVFMWSDVLNLHEALGALGMTGDDRDLMGRLAFACPIPTSATEESIAAGEWKPWPLRSFEACNQLAKIAEHALKESGATHSPTGWSIPRSPGRISVELLQQAIELLAASTGAVSVPASTDDAKPRISVNVETLTAMLDGKEYPIKSRLAACWLKALAEKPGEWFSPGDFNGDVELAGVRTSEVRKRLPKQLQSAIETSTKYGARIKPPYALTKR